MFLALAMAVGALALLALALSNIFKGRVGMGIVIGIMALIIGGGAGTIAAYA